VKFPEYNERPRRRTNAELPWDTVMDDFEPFVRECAKRRDDDPEAHRQKYRILEDRRFEM